MEEKSLVDELFDNFFLEELNKQVPETKRTVQEQNIYEYKYNQLLPLIQFLSKIKKLNMFVRLHTDFNFHTYIYAKELVPFDFSIKDCQLKSNYPSPCVFIENPYSIEISVKNTSHLTFQISVISETHPDKKMIKEEYSNIEDLIKDLSLFLAKNLSKTKMC